jgi:hypothetical protein
MLWFSGRDAAMLLFRDGDRTAGMTVLIRTLSSQQFGLYQEYVSCIRIAGEALTTKTADQILT